MTVTNEEEWNNEIVPLEDAQAFQKALKYPLEPIAHIPEESSRPEWLYHMSTLMPGICFLLRCGEHKIKMLSEGDNILGALIQVVNLLGMERAENVILNMTNICPAHLTGTCSDHNKCIFSGHKLPRGLFLDLETQFNPILKTLNQTVEWYEANHNKKLFRSKQCLLNRNKHWKMR